MNPCCCDESPGTDVACAVCLRFFSLRNWVVMGFTPRSRGNREASAGDSGSIPGYLSKMLLLTSLPDVPGFIKWKVFS